MDRIDVSLLSAPLRGLNLPAGSLGEVLARESGPTLLAFVRHFGCVFCREMLKDIRAAKSADASYPAVVVFGQGTVEESREFFARYWPDVPAVADPEKKFYDGFGLQQGSAFQMFGPRVWACGLRATVKGNFIGKPIGDPWTMPGAFLASPTGELLWKHTAAHAGDHPDWKNLRTLAAASS